VSGEEKMLGPLIRDKMLGERGRGRRGGEKVTKRDKKEIGREREVVVKKRFDCS
jgi:hypothetical protein